MAAAPTPASPPASSPHGIKPGVQPLRAGQGHSYFWRKLHSLSGIVPIGAFLIEHNTGLDEADAKIVELLKRYRNDEKFLKTTKASFKDDAPAFEFEAVDISHLPPRARRYDVTA